MNRQRRLPICLSAFVTFLCALSFGLLAGCYSFGPEQIRGSHPLYNAAVVDAGNEQLLNNLVRLRYRDPTAFLDISSIASTTKLTFSANANGEFSGSDSGFLGLGGTYETYPTISYAPLQGEDFSKRLLSPISTRDLLSLTRSGWSLRRVFGICVEEINDIPNAPSASGPTPQKAPNQYDSWNRLAVLLDRVHDANLIKAHEDESGRVVLEIKPEARNNPDMLALKRRLGLSLSKDQYPVIETNTTHNESTVTVLTRPLMSTLFYLSHHIDVPAADKNRGLVTLTKTKQGIPFDWQQTPAGQLFHIQVAESRPDDAFIATPYRDHWFYIADDDLESKSTFLLLTQLFRLQAGATKTPGPTLTLPVR